MRKHKELLTGVSGSGKTVWMVVTVCDVTGRWLWTETFKSQAEAQAWMKWA